MTRDELEKRAPVKERKLAGYLIRIWLSETFPDGWADFLIYPIVGECDGKLLFQRRGATISPDPVELPEQGEIIVEGFVKWDGCCEFEMTDSEHVCGPEDMADFAKALLEIHKLAAEVLEAYDR